VSRVFNKFSKDARAAVVAGLEEAGRRGDRRVSSEHLLLGLLRDSRSPAAVALGLRADDVRDALAEMDRTALAAVGVEVAAMPDQTPPAARRLPFTAAAKSTLEQTLRIAVGRKDRRLESHHLLLALLARQAPDPVAELLDRLGVDRDAVRSRLLDAA
jgi:ATP-dependent Clp protease ATP-binding subunit ClpA